MEKIFTFIKQGKGIGLLFILASAVLITLMFSFVAKDIFSEIRPKLMLTAEDFLPITIKGGRIVEPANVYKRVTLDLGESGKAGDLFPVVLDTRNDSIEAPKEKYGLFLMRDTVYMVSPTQIRKFALQDGVWTMAEFEKLLDYVTGMFSSIAIVVMIAVFFIGGLFKAWVASVVGVLGLKLAKKSGAFDMMQLMRLNALSVSVLGVLVYALSIWSNINITGLQSFVVVLVLEFWYLFKEGKAEN